MLQSNRTRPLRPDFGQGLLVPGEPANGMLHPVQFHMHIGQGERPQKTHFDVLHDLAQRARGTQASGDSDHAFQARDLIYAGSAHSPRGLSQVRVAGAA